MTDETVVDVQNLTIRFGDFTAVKDVSFSVRRGEIFGFLGANGAGKTTTIRALCGLLRPTEGRLRVAGEGFEGGTKAIKRKVGYMSQKFTLYTDLTVRENLAFAAALRKLTKEQLADRTAHLFDLIKFDQPMNTLVRNLPGGLKQEMSLVAAMLHDPEVIFLDEPTAGVSPVSRARFWSLIRELSGRGKTIFVTTHYMDEAEQCHRIALMRAGEIIALDTPAGLKRRTFPDLLYEVEPGGGAAKDWRERFRRIEGVESLEPHGLFYHAAIKDQSAAERIAREFGAALSVRQIQPSLEDVFIRLVEGVNR